MRENTQGRRRVREIIEHGKAEGWTNWQIVSALHVACQVPLLRGHRLVRYWTLGDAAERIVKFFEASGHGTRRLQPQRISHWEAGQRPNSEYLDLLCQLYETRPDRLGFGVDFTPPEDEVQVAVVIPDRSTPQAVDYSTPDVRLRRCRDVLEQAGLARGVFSGPVLQTIAEICQYTGGLLEEGSVTTARLEQLEASTVARGVDFAVTAPDRLACEMAGGFTHVASLLTGRLSAEQTDRCLRVACKQAALLGLLLVESGQFQAGREWLYLAQRLGDELLDWDLRGWVGAIAAAEPIAIGDWARAARLAEHAAALAPPGAVGRVLALMAQAHGEAHQGRSTHAIEALGQADQEFRELEASLTELSWLGYPSALYQAQRGGVLIRLDMIMLARRALTTALGAAPEPAYRLSAHIRMDLLACDIGEGGIVSPHREALTILTETPAAHRTYALRAHARRVVATIPPEHFESAATDRIGELLREP